MNMQSDMTQNEPAKIKVNKQKLAKQKIGKITRTFGLLVKPFSVNPMLFENRERLTTQWNPLGFLFLG